MVEEHRRIKSDLRRFLSGPSGSEEARSEALAEAGLGGADIKEVTMSNMNYIYKNFLRRFLSGPSGSEVRKRGTLSQEVARYFV